MDQQSTDFSGWSAVKRHTQGPGFWLKFQLGALIYLALPTLIALAINRQFGMEMVWPLFIAVQVADLFLITRYELWATLLVGSTAYSQVGGEEGFSRKDFWDTVPKTLEKVYSQIIITFKWRWFSLFALCVVQTRGNTLLAYPIIACVLVVIAASHRYVSRADAEKARRQVYTVFSSTLFLTIAYAAILGWFPETRPYITAGSAAYRIEQDINAAYEQELYKDADRIGKLLRDMNPKLTFDQKVAALDPNDRAAWERATRGWTREQVAAIKERAYPTLTMTLKEIVPQGVRDWWDSDWFKKKEVTPAPAASAAPRASAPVPAAAPAPAPTPRPAQTAWHWQGTYTPSQGALNIGTPNAGRYCLRSSGSHTQAFWSVDYSAREDHLMFADGRFIANGTPFISQTTTVPFPGKPYGAVWVAEGTNRHWTADGQAFQVSGQEPLILRTNIGPRPEDRLGSGSLQLRVEPC